MTHKLAWLDTIRVFSLILVIYGHFVMVGGYATSIPGIIAPDVALPLMNGMELSTFNLDSLLLKLFSTQAGTLGVTLFFIVTGYLMPSMMERYSRLQFLINRSFRIFPLLIATTLFIGLWLWFAQSIAFSFSSYWTSWTLTYLLFQSTPVMGILWTLVIEVVFYLISALTGRFSVNKLIILQGVMLIFVLWSSSGDGYYLKLLGRTSLFLLLIMIGVSFFLAEKELKLASKLTIVTSSVLISFVAFQLSLNTVGSNGTYENLGTHLLASGFFGLLMLAGRWFGSTRAPKFLTHIANLVYPMYLLHTAVGLSAMALIREVFSNSFVMLTGAICVTILVAWVAHVTVERPFIRLGRRLALNNNESRGSKLTGW